MEFSTILANILAVYRANVVSLLRVLWSRISWVGKLRLDMMQQGSFTGLTVQLIEPPK
ncbi:MAG: hypothetical protein PHP00_14285 [Thiotrichaceae bacterium]|nr:hypothetical protein [Thiotrichaceae bacterium]